MARSKGLLILLPVAVLSGLACATRLQPIDPAMASVAYGDAETTEAEPPLSSRLGHRGADGRFMPIPDATVLVGFGDVGCKEPFQKQETVTFGEDGSFHIPIIVQYTSARMGDFRADGSVSERYCIEDKSYGCYRFKAAGCNDLVLRYDPKKEVPDLLEMRCPHRHETK